MISVVMCTWNRAEQLRRGVYTILSQEKLPDEIVIVDDGSIDNTKDIIDSFRGHGVDINYIYLDHPEPRISCIPRNVGWRSAKGDIIIFTEPEALHVGNTIKKITEAMSYHTKNTILASQVWTMGEKIQGSLMEEYFQDPIKIVKHPYAMLVVGNMQNTNAPDSDWGITGEPNCNAGVMFALKKSWLEGVGGFDESFEGHGFDDFDIFNRLALYGRGIYKDPNIAVIHQWHRKDYGYNIYDMAEKNGKISEANIKKGKYKVND